MNNNLLVLLIIVIIVLVVILFDIVYRYYLLKQFSKAYNWVKYDLAYLTTISGYIRKGKTTLSFGIMHLKTLDLIDKLKSKMNEIESILIDINFEEIRTSYLRYKELGLNHDEIVVKIINSLQINFNGQIVRVRKLDEFYYDYLKNVQQIKLLIDYLYCFKHLIKDHFVYCNVKCFNQITKTYSLDFKYDWIKIKNRDINFNKDFPFEEYSFYLIDEMSLENSNNSAVKKLYEDNGSDVFYRLSGQIFRETCNFVTTLQNVERWFKSDREVFQQHVFVRDSYLINNAPLMSKIINILNNCNNLIYSFYCWILRRFNKSKEMLYLNSNNFFKRMKLKFLNWNKKNISKSFIKFKTSIYTDIDDVGKFIKPEDNSENAYNFDFIIPVVYSWDIGDTHMFHILFDYLRDHSSLSANEIKITELTENDIVDLLTKYNDKNNNSSTDVDF